MSPAPPSVINLEITETDVRDDLGKILKDMSKIRAETINDRNISAAQKDEYLHLTYRLASGLSGIANEDIVKRVGIIGDVFDENNEVSKYDPLQDLYWRKNNPELIQSLDELSILVSREDFHTTDTKHHFMQAVKYMTTQGMNVKEKEKVFDDISPFGTKTPLPKENKLKGLAAILFGSRYTILQDNNLTVRVEGDYEYMPEIFTKLQELGYTRAKVKMWESEFNALKNAGLEGKMIDLVKDESDEGKNRNNIIGYTKRLRDYTLNSLKPILPLAYPIIGALPTRLREKICNYYDIKNDGKQFLFSIAGGIVGGVAIISLSDTHQLKLMGTYLVLESVARFVYAMIKDGNDNSLLPSLPAWIATKPFELMLKYDKKNNGMDNLIQAEFTLQENLATRISYFPENPNTYFENIAALQIPQDIEDNLVWSTKNHSQFGSMFKSYIKSNAKEKPPGIVIIDEQVDKTNSAVIYSQNDPIGNYEKNIGLFCFSGRRYLVTSINEGILPPNYKADSTKILGENDSLANKITKIQKEYGLKFIRAREYINGRLMSDLEGMF